MIDKEFVLVSQGIEIYRTKSQENAVNKVKEYNDEYFDYLQKCYDNYERPADNYVDLEIEYSNEKEKDKEIERLNKENKELKEQVVSAIRVNNIFTENKSIIELQAQRYEQELTITKEKQLKEEIERLNNIINGMEDFFKYELEEEVRPLNSFKVSVWTICLDKLQELKGDGSNDN